MELGLLINTSKVKCMNLGPKQSNCTDVAIIPEAWPPSSSSYWKNPTSIGITSGRGGGAALYLLVLGVCPRSHLV